MEQSAYSSQAGISPSQQVPADADRPLREELQRLKHAFEKIQQATMEQLDKKKVKLKGIKRAVSSYGPDVQLRSVTSFKKVSGSEVDIEDIFSIWNTDMMWSFLDFRLLERLVEQFGNVGMKRSMREYSIKMESFRQRTTVFRLMSAWEMDRPYPPEDSVYEKCEKMIADLGIEAKKCTLAYLEELRMVTCRTLLKGIPLSEAALALFELRPGSIRVTWIVWAEVVQTIRRALTQCVNDGEYFKENNIIRIRLDGEHFMSMERSLMLACVKGDVERVQELLGKWSKNHNINETDPFQEDRPALLLATQYGHEMLVKPLLDHGADIFHTDRNGDNVLTLSKPHGELHSKFQCKCGNEMIEAAKKGDLPLLSRALHMGVDPNAKERDEYGWTALLYACDEGHADVVDCLLDHGADVNAEDSEQWTGLILSSRKGNLQIVKKLLDRGADVNKETNTSWGGVMWAAEQGHTDVARLLLERGAVSMNKDEAMFTPLLIASQNGRIGVLKVLVEYGPEMDVNLQINKAGWSAVMMATKNGHLSVVQYLIDHGSNEHYEKEDEVTALHIACFKGHNMIVRYLCLNKRLDVNKQDIDGITPLMYAAKQGHLEVVKTLVGNKQADVNIAEKDNGWTALFFAMEGHRHEVLEYLLETRRVNVKHKDERGHTLVDIAKVVNPGALKYLSKYNRAEMESMLQRPPVRPVNMKEYEPMLCKMVSDDRITSLDAGPQSLKSYA